MLSYLRNPPWDTGISPPELMAFINNHPPGRALDLGCGTGTNAITLAERGWRVIGIDFVHRAIRKGNQKARQANMEIDFRVNDVTRIDNINGPFDLILDIGCFHSLPTSGIAAYVKNLQRLLIHDGTFLLYAFIIQGGQSDSGVTSDDLSLLDANLSLISRNDGKDRGQRPSAWFTYQLK